MYMYMQRLLVTGTMIAVWWLQQRAIRCGTMELSVEKHSQWHAQGPQIPFLILALARVWRWRSLITAPGAAEPWISPKKPFKLLLTRLLGLLRLITTSYYICYFCNWGLILELHHALMQIVSYICTLIEKFIIWSTLLFNCLSFFPVLTKRD